MGDLRFRWADDSDVDAVVTLVESAYRGDASRAGWTHEADLVGGRRIDAATLRSQMATGTQVRLAEAGTALEGCCALRVDADATDRADAGRVVAFGMFAVVPTRQARGTGSLLLADAVRVAGDEWGAATLALDVIDVRAELIAWYERRGYALTGETEPWPYDDPGIGVPTRPDLGFVVMEKIL